ncbi:PEP-CTERM sorting domain-containing protein [Rhodoferax sp. U11-2br]|uniref:PEP-CTERM sorting domain-containing protein n=1 Tax=Rhodoferax sp. U11-2br TaxID=2838878 RepID=UPI001BECC657|nr:PEP-CTERM sorting domain-containing protein [Rhodoferax sp. U11-2br]MBT3067985.1 PEP-CTERM sorting domain-containing protein [Rhodoferax sp. U11-2br]
MKFKLIALAALLAATGAANAAVDSGGVSGDGTFLASLSYGNFAAGSSASFDLGLSYSQLASWQTDINTTLSGGASSWFRSWNLSTGQYSGTGLTASVIGNYGTVLSDFNAAATAAGATSTAQLQVMALDGVGTTAGSKGIYASANAINTTSGAASVIAATSNTTAGGLNSTTVNGFFGAVNTSGTHLTATNGANLATAGSMAYFNNGGGMEKVAQTSMFDTNGQYNGQYAAGSTTFAGQQQALAFFNQVTSSLTGSNKAKLTAIGYDFDGDGVIEFDNNGALAGGSEYGLWRLQGDVLTFAVAAVPEPESYAMLLAGLGVMGAIARRRRNKSA